MAVINLSVTVPNAQIDRVLTAARLTFGQVDDGLGGLRDMTNAEINERFRQDFIALLKAMVRRSERQIAIAQAENLDTPVDAA